MPKRRCRCLRAAGGEVSRAGLAARLQLSARPRGSLGRRTGRVHPGLAGAPLVPRPVGVLHVVVPSARPREDWDRVLVEPGGGPDAAASRAEQRERIRRGLDALPEHHRAIIMLSDLEGLSYREIAEVLDIPMGTVMSRLHNARKRLRDI